LPSGQPYEFTVRLTEEPPAELVASFCRITGNNRVLGLYYVADADDDVGLLVERTEGRKNITEPLQDAGADVVPGHLLETAWRQHAKTIVLKWALLWLAVQLREQLLVQEIWDPTALESHLLHRLQLRQREKEGLAPFGIGPTPWARGG
jgi:hypothetical protein